MTIPLLYLFSFLFQKAAVNIRFRAFIVNLDPVSALTFLDYFCSSGQSTNHFCITAGCCTDITILCHYQRSSIGCLCRSCDILTKTIKESSKCRIWGVCSQQSSGRENWISIKEELSWWQFLFCVFEKIYRIKPEYSWWFPENDTLVFM